MKKSPLIVVFVTVFIDLVSFGIVIPLLPFYARKFGASGAMIGLLLSVFSLMTFLCMPVLGRLSDRYGRRPVILITVFGSVVAYILFSMAASLSMLFLARILSGAANSNLSVAQAYIADVTPAEKRARGMGLIGAAFGLGFIFGPLISAFSALDYFGEWKYTVPGLIAAGLCLINLGLAYFLLPESFPPENRTAHSRQPLFHWRGLWEALLRPRLGTVIVLFGLATLAYSNIFVSLPLFVQEPPFNLSPSDNSWIFAEIGVISAIIQGGLIGRLTVRFSETRLVIAGTVLMTLGFVGFPVSAASSAFNLSLLAAATALLSVGSSLFTPSSMSIVSRLAEPHEQGAILGIVQSFASLARMAGPSAGGTIYDLAGHNAPYYFSVMIMLVGVVLSARYIRGIFESPAS
jgi:DHA1 family tetracycline resistance protein-like MFS transporter